MELTFDPNDRGQVGIGTLIVFIAMVLVAAIAAGVLINTAGFLQTQAEDTGTESTEQVANNLNIITTVGDVASGGTEVDTVRLGVQPAAGSDDLNLEELSIQFVSDESFSNLVHIQETSAGGDGTIVGESTVFNTEAVTAEDGTDNVMTDNSDRYEVVVPLADSKPLVQEADFTNTDSGEQETLKVDIAFDQNNGNITSVAEVAANVSGVEEEDFVEVNATSDDVGSATLFEANESTDPDFNTTQGDSIIAGANDGDIVRVVAFDEDVEPTDLDGFDENLGEIDSGSSEDVNAGALDPAYYDDLDNNNINQLIEGEEAELTFTTETGAQTVAILQVPDSLAGEDEGDTVDL